MTQNAIRVFFSARLSEPIALALGLHVLRDAGDPLDLGLVEQQQDDARARRTSAHRPGTPAPSTARTGSSRPVASSISARPIRLGGLPTGVSRPPTLAPYASISMIATPTRSRVGSKSVDVLAALDPLVLDQVGDHGQDADRGRQQHRDGRGVGDERRDQAGDRAERDDHAASCSLPTPGSARIRNANRSREPVLEHRLGQDEGADEGEDGAGAERREYGVRAVLPAHAEQDQQRGAEQPETGIGIGSVIHAMMTPPSTAATVCCSCGMSSGSRKMTIVGSGARTNPSVAAPRSKRSSRSESCCSADALVRRPPEQRSARRRRAGFPPWVPAGRWFLSWTYRLRVGSPRPSTVSTFAFASPHPLVGGADLQPHRHTTSVRRFRGVARGGRTRVRGHGPNSSLNRGLLYIGCPSRIIE